MKKFILGRKIGMTQVFADNGTAVPVTVVATGPMTVVQMKTVETDGYNAACFGFEEAKERLVNKPKMGLFKKIEVSPKKVLKEMRLDDDVNFEVGQVVTVADMYADGDKVDVSGITKGKGFQGVIKRHGQAIGRKSHGSHFHRAPGSMGACSYPGKVFKGKKLPGHMGSVRVTIQNLEVVKVDAERNLLLIKGAVPGAKNALLEIKGSVKA